MNLCLMTHTQCIALLPGNIWELWPKGTLVYRIIFYRQSNIISQNSLPPYFCIRNVACIKNGVFQRDEIIYRESWWCRDVAAAVKIRTKGFFLCSRNKVRLNLEQTDDPHEFILETELRARDETHALDTGREKKQKTTSRCQSHRGIDPVETV